MPLMSKGKRCVGRQAKRLRRVATAEHCAKTNAMLQVLVVLPAKNFFGQFGHILFVARGIDRNLTMQRPD